LYAAITGLFSWLDKNCFFLNLKTCTEVIAAADHYRLA